MTETLMAIGGAMDARGRVLEEFFRLAGGAQARIVLLPTASALPDSMQAECTALLEMGLHTPPAILPVRDRESAFQAEHARIAREASGIFFSGGNQMRLTVALAGTPLLAAIFEAFHNSAVVAGTSAGAAALSVVMIAHGRNGQAPRHNQVQVAPGLGFTDRVVFDQHFNQRNRLGRLIYLAAATPALPGVGVDEDTAAVLVGDDLRVVGRGGVTIVDGADLKDTDVAELEKNQLAAYSHIHLHLLTHGDAFNFQHKKAFLEKRWLAVP